MKKYRIELTEKQMRVVEICLNRWMRWMMGQYNGLANDIAFYNIHKFVDSENFSEINREACNKRNHIEEILCAVMRIAFPRSGYGVPDEKSEDGMIAECIWDAIRFARGTSRWDRPFQIGDEPVPKIEVIEENELD